MATQGPLSRSFSMVFLNPEDRCRRVEKSVQPFRASNPGHLAYRANALPTELTGPTHLSTNPV
ncbi:hypothetical protein DPMN_074742 [Dreissena polymorpha]|uniref:Uncharacterized protein n=1 Tax=Dreissena polymorpha TaxID=45954 RepID=A0A9D3YFU2_DREPO|nr:hypothetical protein DPMN_074742 [Dreissena polymorpha]